MKNNKHRPQRLFAAAKKNSELELLVYDIIGDDWYGSGVTPASLQKAIKDAKDNGGFSRITCRINSPGGSSFDGVAIHNILRQQKVPVNVVVEGLAASAAFTVAMAGDTIEVCDGAVMMLHNAWGMAIGDATEMRETADLLDKVSGTLRDIYSKRSGLSADDVKALMDAETWLTAQEAIAKGFATAKLDTTPEKAGEAAALAAQFDLKKFCARVPEKLQNVAADEPCECDCDACQSGDCTSCTMPDCDDPNCEHTPADATAAKAKSKTKADATCECPCEICAAGGHCGDAATGCAMAATDVPPGPPGEQRADAGTRRQRLHIAEMGPSLTDAVQ